MISRVIEAKADDMRAFLEEAAGISRYKERRKETETRIAHTRENLARLSDLRDEVEKQLRHLQRQAATARRYQALKQDERQVHAELLALRLREVESESGARQAILNERDLALQAALAEQRSLEAQIEHARQDHDARGPRCCPRCRVATTRSAPRSRAAEQAIEHAREIRGRQRQELEQIAQGLQEAARAPGARRRAGRGTGGGAGRAGAGPRVRAGRGGGGGDGARRAPRRPCRPGRSAGSSSTSRCARHRRPRKRSAPASRKWTTSCGDSSRSASVPTASTRRSSAADVATTLAEIERDESGGTLAASRHCASAWPGWSRRCRASAAGNASWPRRRARRGARCRMPRAASCRSRRCSAQRSARDRARSSTGSSPADSAAIRGSRASSRWMPAGIVPSRRCSARTSRQCASIRSTT